MGWESKDTVIWPHAIKKATSFLIWKQPDKSAGQKFLVAYNTKIFV